MSDYNLRKNIDNLKELEDNSIEKIYAHISSIFISFIYFVKDDGEDLKIKSRYINNLNTKNHEIDYFHTGRKCILFKLDDDNYHIELCYTNEEIDKIRNKNNI